MYDAISTGLPVRECARASVHAHKREWAASLCAEIRVSSGEVFQSHR